MKSTSLYLHVPFCYHFCPYCPYTKFPYDEELIEPYTKSALAEIDWWADKTGLSEVTSIYIGGGTPTLALRSIADILDRIRERFHLTGDICIETNPVDVNDSIIRQLHDAGISLVSLGVQSFNEKFLKTIGRTYEPGQGMRSLELLAKSGFSSVNADIMFALPEQTSDDVVADLTRVSESGADQITTYPLFTFPYTSVGEYMRLSRVKMPRLRMRMTHYQAISQWSSEHGFERVSVWGFKRGGVPRYSSVTRDGYIGIGPGAGSHLPEEFVLNTFDLSEWISAAAENRSRVALRMPFRGQISGWWWLYWRFYDTRIPLGEIDSVLRGDAVKVRRWLKVLAKTGYAIRKGNILELTDRGAFWLHLVQNYFALTYVNTLWTAARRTPWPKRVPI